MTVRPVTSILFALASGVLPVACDGGGETTRDVQTLAWRGKPPHGEYRRRGERVRSVFASNGSWLAALETPGDLVTSVSNRRVFGCRIDDFDVKHIEAFELVPPERPDGARP